MARANRRLTMVCGLATLAVAACTGAVPSRPAASGTEAGQQAQATHKVLTMGITTIIDAFSIAGSSTTTGGGLGIIEIHSQAMFTADKTTGRPIPRLLAEQPTTDNGGLRLTDDGGMISTYKLRPDVKWADGTPLTAQDLLFSFRVAKSGIVQMIDSGPARLMGSAEAPDDRTFVIHWNQPYYLADAIGLRALWPLPAHILEADYATMIEEQKDPQAWYAKPYWTSEYVHVGPFKLVEFTPQVEAVFDRVDDYFLGRPKVDRIVVKQFTDSGTTLANALAGGIDMGTETVLNTVRALELKRQWDANGGGTVWFGTGNTWFVSIQFDSNVPNFVPVLMDPRVRQALIMAIDRDSFADSVTEGVPNTAAYAILPPDNPLFSYVKDGWKTRYPYDAARSAATFESAGWHKGGDGVLTNAVGDRMHFELRTTADSERKLAILGDMWKQAGADPEQLVIPAARARDTEYRQQFPGGEITARGSQDSILTRLELSEQPRPANRYAGNNRGHWSSDQYEALVTRYRSSLREEDRGEAMKEIQDLMLDELPLLILYYEPHAVFARKGVTAFQDDFAGGSDAGRAYGTYSRNAHEWDIQG
ncbi:MAG TPA: ABC transporter substrate-binding protein [Chloroflexota bacterium]|nr:ABC transporter substrate-binding protein [Chloroflexota bacterium]